jgi:hypothetical protein
VFGGCGKLRQEQRKAGGWRGIRRRKAGKKRSPLARALNWS